MSCGFPKEMLALKADGDLPPRSADRTSAHLAECEDCRRYVEHLQSRLVLLMTLRSETASQSQCTSMRRDVMAIINDRAYDAGPMLRLERALMVGHLYRRHAMAAAVVLCLLSVALLAQIRQAPHDARSMAPEFDGREMLIRPETYRDWVVVGSNQMQAQKVFMSPAAYRRYRETGRFPEGTVMIWERSLEHNTSADAHGTSAALLASVKDSAKFGGGWGFFDFTAADGTVAPKAKALPESRNCGNCHRQDAETDHVFTQFYPVLRSARQATPVVMQRGRVTPANT